MSGRWRRRRLGLLLGGLGLIALGAQFIGSLDGELAVRVPSKLLTDRRGQVLGELPGSAEGWGYWPVPAQLPEKILAATLETEDRHFYSHRGVHLPSIGRAALQNLRSFRIISGASTIPMQVARMQHPKRRTVWGKAREAAEALLLIRAHGHDAVLRQYLTLAPYGNRCHGVVRAARLYFDKPVEDLSWLQAAYLAALPQQPGHLTPWNPVGHAAAYQRATRILKQLHARGYLSDEDLRIALSSNLSVVPKPVRRPEALHALLAFSAELERPSTELGTGPLYPTTLDMDFQSVVHEAVAANLRQHRSQGAGNAAAVVVDLPTGDILAYVGSADYFDPEARGAIDYLRVRRSPGSALKPFIYAVALEKGTHTAASEVPDAPVTFELNAQSWTPQNITHNFFGPMRLRPALGNSRNIPALHVLAAVGVDEMAGRFAAGGVRGVSFAPEAYGLPLALGALPVTPLELARLYTALANQGQVIPLRRFLQAPVERGPRILSRDAAMLVAHILADPEARRPSFSAGNPLEFDYAVAAKTGTSQGHRDAWTAAFSDRLLVISWMGNHDYRRMNLVSGATAAAPAARAILEALMPQRAPHRPLALRMPLPPNAVEREVCALSGKLAREGCTHLVSEAFIAGTEPTERCPFHREVAIDVRNGLLATPECPAQFVRSRPMLKLPETYASWARGARLLTAPTVESPLCAPSTQQRAVKIREPRPRSRYLFDPDTPSELSTLRLAASVSPLNEEVVWLVDGQPIGRVGYPHELRWPLTPGTHVIRARLALSGETSAPVTVYVDD